MHWQKAFHYNDGKLYWTRTGKEAGSNDGHGYLQTQYKGVRCKNHRIIWELMNGEIPEGMQIDHINRDRSDNRIENLRLVTPSGNCENRECKGYTWSKHAKKWMSQIHTKGKTIYLGYFNTKEEAHQAYLTAKETYHEMSNM